MRKESIKARWKTWENTCIKKAFEEKIQHKIMALILGRSISAISKRINKLGLRKPTPFRGRIKGDKNIAPWHEKTPRDFTKMKEIFLSYAPLEITQKEQWLLQEGSWSAAKPLSNDVAQTAYIDSIGQENALVSLSLPLEYILSKDPLPENSRKEKFFGNPLYVSFSHIEHWAISEGFHHVKENLRQVGVFYWKDGKHFSKAQLLIYINRIRFENKLRPLALYEENKVIYQRNSNC